MLITCEEPHIMYVLLNQHRNQYMALVHTLRSVRNQCYQILYIIVKL